MVSNALRLRFFVPKFKTGQDGPISAPSQPENPLTASASTGEIIMIKKLKIEGMTCKHCSGRVEKILSGLPGVEKAVVDLDSGQAEVTIQKELSDQTLTQPVTDAGYPAQVLS